MPNTFIDIGELALDDLGRVVLSDNMLEGIENIDCILTAGANNNCPDSTNTSNCANTSCPNSTNMDYCSNIQYCLNAVNWKYCTDEPL